jgi:FkbM family methyltransferase
MIGNAVLADLLISQLCPSDGTFIDIGGYIGSIFSSVHHADKTIEIIAFEADPTKARHLAARFPYCTVHAVAVSDQPGEVEFYLNPSPSGYNSLVKSGETQQTMISVEMAKLDDVLEGQRPDVMKIDIEGAELGALRGGEKLIAANTPTIMFESTDIGVNTLGYSPQLIWKWFRDIGYDIYAPDRLAHDAPGLNWRRSLTGTNTRCGRLITLRFIKINVVPFATVRGTFWAYKQTHKKSRSRRAAFSYV